MPRAGILLLAALLLSAIFALFFWPDSSREAASSNPHPPAPAQPKTADAELTLPAVVTTEDRTETAEVAVEGVGDLLPPYGGQDGFLVKVIDEASQTAVAGADVFVVSEEMAEYALLGRSGGRNWACFNVELRKHGHHYQTDESGTVRLPLNGRYRRLFCEKGDLYSPARPHWKDEEITFELRPNLQFRVKVVAESGEAVADVPIELLSGEEGYGSCRHLVHTDNDGIALLEGLHEEVESSKKYGSLSVGFGFPIARSDQTEETQVLLTDELLERGELTLKMQPTCSLEVLVFEATGEACTEIGSVTIKSRWDEENHSETRSYALLENGRAFFPMIGLNVDLFANFHAQESRSDDTIDFRSPTIGGEHLVVEIRRAPRSFVTGRLVDASGNPLAYTKLRTVEWLESENDDRGSGNRVVCDDEGRFQYELQNETDLGRILKRDLELSWKSDTGIPHKKMISLPASPDPGNYDLGDVFLPALPLIASGTIVDESGNPIVKARVTVSQAYSLNNGRQYWNPATREDATTDELGHFQLFGELEGGEAYRLNANAKGYSAASLDIALGKTGHTISMHKPQLAFGSLLLDDALRPRYLRCYLAAEGLNSSWGKMELTEDPNIANLSFNVKAGIPYTAQIRTDLGEVLLEVPNISIGDAPESRPPALQNLDLRGKAKRISLEITNTDGDLLPADFYFRNADSSGRSDKTLSGKFETLIAAEIAVLHVQSKGYVSKELKNVSESQSIVLQKAVPVTFHIGAEFLARKNHSIYLKMPGDGDLGWERGNKFGKDGRLSSFVPTLGNHELKLTLMDEAVGSSNLGTLSCEVTHEGQVILLKLDRQAFDRAVQDIESRKNE